MKKIVIFLCLCILSNNLIGCEPLYPLGDLEISPITSLAPGESVEIEFLYPDGGISVSGWKDETVEIVTGADVIEVSGYTVTGLKPGTAVIKVEATTVLTEGAVKEGDEERVYSTEVKIEVE